MYVAKRVSIHYNIIMRRFALVRTLLLAMLLQIPFAAVSYSENWLSRPAGFSDYVPETSKPTVVISTETVPKESYSATFLRFWEDLTGDAIDDLCKAAQIKLNTGANFADDVINLKAGFKRSIRRFPNNQLALVDEVLFKPNFGLNVPLKEAAQSSLPFSLNLSLNASVEGKSQVVRPLRGENYCTELKTLVKIQNVKTAWPPTQKRIAEMNVGEIWKLPLTFHVGVGIGASATAYKSVTFSLGGSMGKEISPSVTLFRMSKDKMRLRVRIGMAKMSAIGASVSTVKIPVEDLALWHTDNFIAEFLNKEWAREINKVLETRFSFTKDHYKGKKLVLEFVLNPQNPEHVKAVAEFMRGNFGILKKFIELHLDFSNLSDDQSVEETAQSLQEMADIPNGALNASQTYAGASHFDGNTSNSNIHLPVVYKRDSQKEKVKTTYQAVGSDEKMEVYKKREYVKVGHMNVPFAGSASTSNRETTSYVVQKEYKDGKVSKPTFMYKEYTGGVRVSGGKADDAVENANDILQYVGTQGNGPNKENTLKTEDILPNQIETEDGKTVKSSRVYNAVSSEFKLMISERGIQEIIFAPAAAIMRAFFSVVSDKYKDILDKAEDLFSIDEQGKVSYNRSEASRRFSAAGNMQPLVAMRRLAAKATSVIADIFSVKKAYDDKDQASRFANLAQGGGTLGANDFLKVVVQLLDPSQVSASFTMDSKNKKTGKHHYSASVFNSGENVDASLKEVQEAEGRFSDPALLTD